MKVYIGPNGFGKTTFLQNEFKKLQKKDEGALLIPSEIIFSEETKTTKDGTLTMDIVLEDILNPNITTEKKTLEEKIDNQINFFKPQIQKLADDISKFNGVILTKDIISISTSKEYKKLFKFENDFISKNFGSGLSSLFIIKLLNFSLKKYIILDEPDKFCHPSFLNEMAKEINGMAKTGKEILISTHNPDFVKLLDFDLKDLFILNEFDKNNKTSKLEAKLKQLSINALLNDKELQNFGKELKNNPKRDVQIIGEYITDINKLEKYLKVRRPDFLDLLFSNEIYLVEGINDKIFLDFFISDLKERKTIITFTKFAMPIYLSLLKQVKHSKMNIYTMFDIDGENDTNQPWHKSCNDYIRQNSNFFIAFKNNLEKQLNFLNEKSDCIAFFDFLLNNPSNYQNIKWKSDI